MRIRIRYVLAVGAIAALFGAPAAAAQQSCTGTGGDTTVCQTPGNVQINDSPAEDFTLPYWDEAFGGAYTGGPYPVPYDEGSGDLGSPAGRR
jgi:hypothetical protein